MHCNGPGKAEMSNEEMERKWREIYSLHFLIFFLFPPSLSISYNKNGLIMSQNTPWENKSGSHSLQKAPQGVMPVSDNDHSPHQPSLVLVIISIVDLWMSFVR